MMSDDVTNPSTNDRWSTSPRPEANPNVRLRHRGWMMARPYRKSALDLNEHKLTLTRYCVRACEARMRLMRAGR